MPSQSPYVKIETEMPQISRSLPAKPKPPASIILASVFISLCSVALVAFAVALFLASLKVPNNPVYATRIQTRGFIFLVGIIIIGACILLKGVHQLLTQRRPKILFVCLGVPLAFGCIGETVDLFGTASHASDAIGAGILLLFAIPIVLLLLPSSRQWVAR